MEFYKFEDVRRVVDALDDCDGWVKAPEAYEASAMIQALFDQNIKLVALLTEGKHLQEKQET